ncbi:MAG: AMP-dependent synthetase, partial [Phenylobacterium sp.]|nr:AMP-dependent synthetase [Phenylobacterium sp.]
VVLGALIATSKDMRERLWLLPVAAAYAGVSAWFYGPNQGSFILVSSLLLLGLPRVSLPRFSSGLVFTLAGASLWIYLTHMLLRDAFNRVGGHAWPGLSIVLALGGGVALWMFWNRGVTLARQWTKRPEPLVADATV